jgi:hypothetical protein
MQRCAQSLQVLFLVCCWCCSGLGASHINITSVVDQAVIFVTKDRRQIAEGCIVKSGLREAIDDANKFVGGYLVVSV